MSVDSPAKSRALQKRLGVGFPIYSDAAGAASRAWHVFDADTEISLAATFVVAKGGAIRFRFIGRDKTDRPTVDALIDAVR